MNEDNSKKLDLFKFCLGLIYPQYHYLKFFIFLVIKYKVWCRKRIYPAMGTFELRTIPLDVTKQLVKQRVEENYPVIINKCIIISRQDFVLLASENLFYVDNGVLWMVMKLTQDEKKKHKDKRTNNAEIKHNLNFMTTELYKKLWTDKTISSIDNMRLVPLVGCKDIPENIAFTNEIEYSNILSCFNLDMVKGVTVSFHPLLKLDNAPKIASLAEVCLIVNEYDLDNDFIKEVLKNHFEIPKLVTVNDIFSIELTPEITAKYHYKYLDLVESAGRLYFKCKRLSSEVSYENNAMKDNLMLAFLIIKGVTQLTLGENIHSVKPKDEYFKLQQSENLHSIHLCPAGLRDKFNLMQEAIQPFISGEINELSASMSSPIIPMLLLTGTTGSGRHILAKILAKYNGLNCLPIDCNMLQSSTAKQTESKVNAMVQKAKTSAPVLVLLENFEVFAVDPENNEDFRVLEYFLNTITDLYQNYTKHPIIFIAITERQDLKPNMLRMFLDKFHIPRLNVEQRYKMLEWFATVMQLNIGGEELPSNRISTNEELDCLGKPAREVLKRVAAKTETFLYGDLDTLLHFAIRESYLKQHSSYNKLPYGPDLHLVYEEDFNSALESIRSLQSQHLDAPKIPKVYWEDIGGLDKLKKELLKTIEFPIKYPHLFKNSSLKRSGILLYGPPGCGKTLVAKAVSTELNVSFLSVKGPELLNMYIGQSEENVRKVFEAARASSPCIVFLDELDALAPRRGAAGDSGGASDRVVSQLLAELDGVTNADDADTSSLVFIMGATNRPDLLDQSLLRPGRLDKLIYVGPYSGPQEKTCVLKALCRNYKLREEVELETVASALPDCCTGADLLQVVSTARSAAIRGLVSKLHAGLVKESELSPDSVILGNSEMWVGVESFRPSVTSEELRYYESLQSQM